MNLSRLADVEKRLSQVEERLSAVPAMIERVETAFLTEFHKWASPNDQKMRTHRESLRAPDLQIEAIAGRVEKLEADMDLRH